MVLEAILLGLSTGTYCTMYCAPVLIPFCLAAKKAPTKGMQVLPGLFFAEGLQCTLPWG